MPEADRPTPSMMIIVPRERPDLDRALRHAFSDDVGVRLVADRRATNGARNGEHPAGERRERAERDAALGAGRWVVVPLAARRVNLADPDVQARLFVACGDHVVACERCQDTYRFRWIRPEDRETGACPRCGNDLSAAVAAHIATCGFWGTPTTQSRPGAQGSSFESVA